MRRPGFLGFANYWFGNVAQPFFPRTNFGNSCWVCNGKRCRNICTTEEQVSQAKKRHKKLRSKASKQPTRRLRKSIDESKFKLIPGESHNARLIRLQKAGLYTPGGLMGRNYANLIHFGTRNPRKIRQIKAERAKKAAARNLQRYGTTDIKKIEKIVEAKRKARDAMWRRVYGTDDPDKIYAISESRRKALCDADPACVKMRKQSQK